MRRASLAPIPLLIPALAYALGLWAAWEYSLSIWLVSGLSVLGIGFCVAALRLRWRGFLIGLTMGFLGLGALSLCLSEQQHQPRFSPVADGVVVQFIEPLWSGKADGGWRGALEGQVLDGQLHEASGQLVLWTDQTPLPGDRVFVASQPFPAPRSAEPLAPARGDLMARIGLHYELWLDSTNHSSLTPLESLTRWLTVRRQRLRDRLYTSGLSDSDAALLSALLLGDRSALEQVQWDRFRAGGAAHALAVSGLHVGIVYALFLALFGGARRKGLRGLVLPLLGLWAFALLAGAAPSVLRAATMLTFFHLGLRLRRNSSPLNLWAAAGLILLILSPWALFQIGFQFSFLAILGILLLDPLATRLWNPRIKAVRYFWRLLVAGFSASLFILPVQAYHFHTFQPYGPLGSLLTIPWLISVVWAGLILLVLADTDVGRLLAECISGVNRLHDHWLDGIGSVPGATVNLPGYSIVSTFLLLLVLLLGIAATLSPSVRWRWAWVACLVACLGLRLLDINGLGHERLVVYKSALPNTVEWQEGSNAKPLGLTVTQREGLVLRRERTRLHQALGIRRVSGDETTWQPLPDGAGWAAPNGKATMVRAPFHEPLSAPLPVDVLVLTHWKAPPELLWSNWQPKLLVLSSELPPWVRREQTELAAIHHAEVHDVWMKGTFLWQY